jgi:hypothetical protein
MRRMIEITIWTVDVDISSAIPVATLEHDANVAEATVEGSD